MRLRIVVASGSNMHQRCIGKEGSKLARPAMKLYLKVKMALYAEFVRWRFGGTSWNFISRPQKWRFSASKQ